MTTTLKTLITKLNRSCRTAAEQAASLTLSRGHFEVDIEHLLLALLDQPRCDLVLLLRQFDLSAATLRRDLEAELSRLKTGNTRTPVFSARLPTLLEHAWLIASLDGGTAQIRSAHLLLATPALDQFTTEPHQYTTNLTQRAREGRLDPVLGRDAEIRQIIDILTRRGRTTRSSPARPASARPRWSRASRCASPPTTCPTPLRGVELHALDIGLLQAGAGVKGEFENRLKQVIEEVKSSRKPIILFIDEAHTLIGAGGAGRPERRRQPAEAGTRARRAAHDRGDHVGRVQEVLREGRGAGAALPGGQGRRARARTTRSR
jgi:type VI secretion system protein VasG